MPMVPANLPPSIDKYVHDLHDWIRRLGSQLTAALIKEIGQDGIEKKIGEVCTADSETLILTFVTVNGTTYLDLPLNRDWRGRMVQWEIAFQDPANNPVEDWQWNMNAYVGSFRVGSNFNFQGGLAGGPFGDYLVSGATFGSISTVFYIEDATGKFKVVVSGVGAPTPAMTYKIRLRASDPF